MESNDVLDVGFQEVLLDLSLKSQAYISDVKDTAMKLLSMSKIEPTPIRISLLLFFIVDSKGLTISQVVNLARQEFPSISKSVVSATLRLYKARNLLKEVEELGFRTRRGLLRGRPEVKMYFIHKTDFQ